MNGKHFQATTRGGSGTKVASTGNQRSTGAGDSVGRGQARPKSTNLGSSNYSKSSTLPPKKQQPESEIPVAVNITSIYPEVVELICSNTKCERKIAEKTFSDIAQLVNASIACQVNDSLTAEVVAKLFHIKVDPAKNLLSSLSFALTVILNGGGQTPEQANEGSGEQNGELVAEDGSQVVDRPSNVYESAKSIDELVSLMDEHWTEILDRISKSANKSSVLPLVDYLSLYVTTLANSVQDSPTANKQASGNPGSKQTNSSSFSIAITDPEVRATLDTIIGFILDIVTCSDHANAHLVHNTSLFQICVKMRLSHCKSWSVLATLMLVQGASQLAATLNKDQITCILNDVITSESAPDAIIPLLLALNLGFLYPSQNTFLSAFVNCSSHEVTDFFLSEVIALFNRNLDPLINYQVSKPDSVTNSVLKLMIDIFSSKSALKKIYTTDQKVILDVILTSMTDLSPGSQERVDMMSLLDLAVKNVAMMREEPKYKLPEFLALIQPISEQIDCLEEALIARSILSNLNL